MCQYCDSNPSMAALYKEIDAAGEAGEKFETLYSFIEREGEKNVIIMTRGVWDNMVVAMMGVTFGRRVAGTGVFETDLTLKTIEDVIAHEDEIGSPLIPVWVKCHESADDASEFHETAEMEVEGGSRRFDAHMGKIAQAKEMFSMFEDKDGDWSLVDLDDEFLSRFE